MKYIKPKCEVIEMEDIVMNVVSKPTTSGIAPDGGNPDDVEAGENPPPLLSKDVFPWSDDFDMD